MTGPQISIAARLTVCRIAFVATRVQRALVDACAAPSMGGRSCETAVRCRRVSIGGPGAGHGDPRPRRCPKAKKCSLRLGTGDDPGSHQWSMCRPSGSGWMLSGRPGDRIAVIGGLAPGW